MNYLILQAEYTGGRHSWHEVWNGFDRLNAKVWGCHFARLNERPTILLQLQSTGPDMAIPTVLSTWDAQGYGRNPDEASE